ncbi:hypothetical protein CMU17_10380 [Elizabethkingia anophelis]|nr:hypothetical protein [Elizabethkingia anophelis]MDV3758101.1 hypothetical protein [Elizabethkingia anophelis]MDV3859188.1 hypothetical protein [Elizabethkingia anophelis]OCW72475.1 hypothetical protein A4G24_12215 [Elizabethkingia anophelis]
MEIKFLKELAFTLINYIFCIRLQKYQSCINLNSKKIRLRQAQPDIFKHENILKEQCHAEKTCI